MFKNLKKDTKDKYWQKHISKWEQSEVSQKEYCKSNNLVYDTFRSWRKKLSVISPDDLIKVPVKIINESMPADNCLEIIINEKIKIKIPDNFNPETLKVTIETLGTVKC